MTDRELFDCYSKDVYRTCFYMLRNAQDAEDVCHDVFVTVFQKDWQKIEHVQAWIMRITMNHCLNLISKNKTKIRNLPRLRLLHNFAETSVKAVDAGMLEKEDTAEWERLLKQLPDKLLAVITLRYIGELSIAEIAETLSIPQGTVKSRLHKALKRIRKQLEQAQPMALKGEKRIGTY